MSVAVAVCAAAFLTEEGDIAYFDEFNGNDYAATHPAFASDDPAGGSGCWFAFLNRSESAAYFSAAE